MRAGETGQGATRLHFSVSFLARRLCVGRNQLFEFSCPSVRTANAGRIAPFSFPLSIAVRRQKATKFFLCMKKIVTSAARYTE